jgi:hypothetical protein
MFTKLNSLISRTIIAAAVPVLVTVGLSGHAQADWNDIQPIQYMPQANTLSYTGEANGLTVTMMIDYGTIYGNTVRGTMTINGTEYQYIMQLVQNDFEGVINAGDRQIPFTGTTQGTTVYLDMLNTHLVLQPGT